MNNYHRNNDQIFHGRIIGSDPRNRRIIRVELEESVPEPDFFRDLGWWLGEKTGELIKKYPLVSLALAIIAGVMLYCYFNE